MFGMTREALPNGFIPEEPALTNSFGRGGLGWVQTIQKSVFYRQIESKNLNITNPLIMHPSMVTLYEESRPEIKIQITASINEKSDLLIQGVDSGELVKKLKGDFDYEYFLTVRKADKILLINQLQCKNINVHNDQDLLRWLKDNYSHNEAISSLISFLEKEKIKFETFFWV
jgi:hypothetical protein